MAAEFGVGYHARVGDPELSPEVGEPVAGVEAIVEFYIWLLGVKVQDLQLATFFRCIRFFVVVVLTSSILTICLDGQCRWNFAACNSLVWTNELAVFGIRLFLDGVGYVSGEI